MVSEFKMNRVDFNFFDGEDNEQSIPVFKAAQSMSQKLAEFKERAIIEALEELEGKVPTKAEVQQHGEIRRYEGGNKEVLYWRGNAAVLMTWSFRDNQTGDKMELKFNYKKLYSPT